jgi:hypothetical protein
MVTKTPATMAGVLMLIAVVSEDYQMNKKY